MAVGNPIGGPARPCVPDWDPFPQLMQQPMCGEKLRNPIQAGKLNLYGVIAVLQKGFNFRTSIPPFLFNVNRLGRMSGKKFGQSGTVLEQKNIQEVFKVCNSWPYIRAP
jgi:hypothetical protein